MEIHQDLFNQIDWDFTLLYVEDSLVNREYTLKILKPHFAEILTARDGSEGLNLFRERNPDMVITDVRMPVMDGIAMSERIKEINRDIPIIITSAHSDRDVLMQSIRTGITRFIMKPINVQELLQTIEELKLLILLRRRLSLQTKFIKAVLDSQNFITIITDGVMLYGMNQFALAFTGYPNMTAFNNDHQCICDFFLDGDGLINNSPDWLRQMMEASLAPPTVRMVDSRDGSEHTFTVSCNELPDFGGRFVVSFFDVTLLEENRQEMEKLATTDPLTGAFNRHHFNALLQFNIEKIRRYDIEQTFSILIFDLDFFKTINDSYGHLVGDAVLKEFTELIQSKIRKSDLLARWGGEEFVLLAPETDLGAATILAEKLRAVVEQHAFASIDIDRRLTSSVGVTSYRNGDSLNTLMDRADRALYQAKEAGRNCVFPG